MKINSKILAYTLLALVATGGVSCKKYLNINTDPTAATTVEPKLLFGYAITAWDVNKNSGDAWIPIALMTQNVASGGNFGWGAGDVYDISVFSLGNTWKVYYNTAGNNLQLAIKNALEAKPVNKNAAAQSRIVLSQLMYEATTLYGDIPFSEAWNPDIPYPKYDAQKDVLEGIIKWLDLSLSELNETDPLKISDYDVYYGGNIASWKKLANSIKFKILMLMVDKDPSKAAAIGQLLSNPNAMISTSAETWQQKYKTTTNNENPKYRLNKTYTNGENQWFFANQNVFQYMQPKNDPRIPKFFDKGPAATTFQAVETEQEASTSTSLISAYLMRPNAPSVLLSYQEILLLQAEAYARGLGVTKDLVKANDLFKKGVEESMKFYEADPTEIQTYLTTQLPNLTTAADPVKEIHIQQWIDLMDRPMEAFVQWRRSGPEGSEVPTLTLPPGAPAGPLIRRWTYSPDEIAANPNIPNPQPKYYDKMWFDL
jgi:hypothetical protein